MGAAFAPIMLGVQTLSKVSQIKQQANQMQAMYENQAKLQENAANVERLKASQAADKYADEERKIINTARVVQSKNNASAGASNLNLSGSLADVNDATADEATRDLRTSLLNQRATTFGYRTNEAYDLANAANYRTAGDNVQKQANSQIFSTILGSVGTAYGQGMFGSSGSSGGSSDWLYNKAGNTPWGNISDIFNNNNGWTYSGASAKKGYSTWSW